MKSRKLSIALFMVYLVTLSWIVLFKTRFAFTIFGMKFLLVDLEAVRSINLIPFGAMLMLNGMPSYTEVIYNVLAFMPFGVFMCMLGEKKALAARMAPIVVMSLLFEAAQYIFAIGVSDITDLLANSLGGLAGAGVFFVFHKLCRENVYKVINTTALVLASGFALLISMMRPL